MQRALAGWRGLDVELHALFPRGEVQSPKVRAFVDFLVESLRVEENYMRALSDDNPCSQQLAAEAVAGTASATPSRAGKQSQSDSRPDDRSAPAGVARVPIK